MTYKYTHVITCTYISFGCSIPGSDLKYAQPLHRCSSYIQKRDRLGISRGAPKGSGTDRGGLGKVPAHLATAS